MRAAVSDGEWEVVVVVSRIRQQESADRRQETPAKLTGLDRAILGEAQAQWRSATWLAHRLDREPDSYFRERLRHLARAGRLLHDHRGYRLPG